MLGSFPFRHTACYLGCELCGPRGGEALDDVGSVFHPKTGGGTQEGALRRSSWQKFLGSPPETKHGKEGPVHLDLRRKNGSLWKNKTSQPAWNSELAILDAQPDGGLTELESASRVRCQSEKGIRRLCEDADLAKAVDSLLLMEERGKHPSVQVCGDILQACVKRNCLVEAKQVHLHLIKCGLEVDRFWGENLVQTLVKCGSLRDALDVFNSLPHRTVFSWTAIISGYSNEGDGRGALRMYQKMLQEGVKPNSYTFLSLLKACSSLFDLEAAKAIHSDVVCHGYDNDLFVGTTLVHTYGRCGSIADARQAFDALPQRNVVAWNAMIAGYTEQGQGQTALDLYAQMQKEGIKPNVRTFVTVLKACGNVATRESQMPGDGQFANHDLLAIGRNVHVEVLKRNFGKNVFIGSSLVRMYTKCQSIVEAREVFDKMSERNVVTWNAIITGYANEGKEEEVLTLYARMRDDCVSPDDRTFVRVLKACASLAHSSPRCSRPDFLEKGKAIHTEATRSGYDSDLYVGNTLINMYAKCGSIVDARRVFDSLPKRDVVSWNSMIVGYAEQEQGEEAWHLYGQMQQEGVNPDVWTFASMINACSSLADKEQAPAAKCKAELARKGKVTYGHATQQGYGSDVFLGNSLINLYAKCGCVADARDVFDTLQRRDVVSWNAMIGGYAQQAQGAEALHIYALMHEEGVKPDAVTFLCLLEACNNAGALNVCIKTHSEVVLHGFEGSVSVATALIHAYSKCGSMVNAERVFDGMPQHDVWSWTSLIAGYCLDPGTAGQGHDSRRLSEIALERYEQMQKEGIKPNDRTFVSLLKACSSLAEPDDNMCLRRIPRTQVLQVCKGIHDQIVQSGYVFDTYVGNSLVSVYSKCGSIEDARHIFDQLPSRNVVSWNAMIAGYALQDMGASALQLFNQMKEERVSPDVWTFSSVLKACGSLAEVEQGVSVNGFFVKPQALEQGKSLHADAIRMDYASNVSVANSLVIMYSKCGSMECARQVFDALPTLDVVPWCAMIVGYVHQGHGETAFQLYHHMKEEGVVPDEQSFVSLLQGCSNMGALNLCCELHRDISARGYDATLGLSTALIHAYSKCGNIVDARKVFDSLPKHDAWSWTALIAGYAQQGEYDMSMQCFEQMCDASITPDGITFLALLSACSWAGMVDKGLEYFRSMSRDYNISPKIEHYGSVVDLLGRVGLFKNMEELLSQMPMQPDLAMWLSVLSACRTHENVALGRTAFEHATSIEPKQPAAYLLMSHIYAHAGMAECAEEVELLRQRAGARRHTPGQTWIEHGEQVNRFVVGDQDDHQVHGLLNFINNTLSVVNAQYPISWPGELTLNAAGQ